MIENVVYNVGTFLVAFNKPDPNHEYPFTVRSDGFIVPEYDFLEKVPTDPILFYKYLSDADIHHVRFVQCTPLGEKDIIYDPF